MRIRSIYGPILWVMCKGPIQWEYAVCTKDQSYGDTMHVTKNLMRVQRTNPMGHVQRTNPMGICCMYKGPILWGHDACYKEPDACTEDQSYGSCAKDQSNGNMLYVQRTNPMGTRCMLQRT